MTGARSTACNCKLIEDSIYRCLRDVTLNDKYLVCIGFADHE